MTYAPLLLLPLLLLTPAAKASQDVLFPPCPTASTRAQAQVRHILAATGGLEAAVQAPRGIVAQAQHPLAMCLADLADAELAIDKLEIAADADAKYIQTLSKQRDEALDLAASGEPYIPGYMWFIVGGLAGGLGATLLITLR